MPIGDGGGRFKRGNSTEPRTSGAPSYFRTDEDSSWQLAITMRDCDRRLLDLGLHRAWSIDDSALRAFSLEDDFGGHVGSVLLPVADPMTFPLLLKFFFPLFGL